MDKAMKLNRVERRLLMLLGIKFNQGDSAIELYKRIRLKYKDRDSYWIAAYNSFDEYLHLTISKHMPNEYVRAIDRLNPYIIHAPNQENNSNS